MAIKKNYTVIAKNGLNVREEAGKHAHILNVLPFDTKVVVDPDVDAPNGWIALKDGGFVMTEYLK